MSVCGDAVRARIIDHVVHQYKQKCFANSKLFPLPCEWDELALSDARAHQLLDQLLDQLPGPHELARIFREEERVAVTAATLQPSTA